MPGSYPRFPGGVAGVGLLLLRVLVGGPTIVAGLIAAGSIQAGRYGGVIVPVGTVLLGSTLMLGLWTRTGATLAALTSACVALRWTSASVALAWPVGPAAALALVSSAIALLGPGAFSIDARLFGHREVVLPRLSDRDGRRFR